MKALTDKITDALQHKYDAFIGNQKDPVTSANAKGFKEGLEWAIETINCLEKEAEFKEVARVMMKHLGNGEKYHPHHIVIITNSNAQLVEGVKSTGNVEDYIPD